MRSMQNVIGSIRVLTKMANSSRTAYRHPVRISPHAFLCDLCGERAVVTGPAGRTTMKHQCPGGDMFEEFPGATRYVGLREHAKRVWAAFTRDLPRRVTAKRSEPEWGLFFSREVLAPFAGQSASITINSKDISQESIDAIYGAPGRVILNAPQHPEFNTKPASEGLRETLEHYGEMGQEIDTEAVERQYASGFEFPPRYQMKSEGIDKREAD